MTAPYFLNIKTTLASQRVSLALRGAWEVFATTQRFNPGERRRLLAHLGLQGEPVSLSIEIAAQPVEVYAPTPAAPARGIRLGRPTAQP